MCIYGKLAGLMSLTALVRGLSFMVLEFIRTLNSRNGLNRIMYPDEESEFKRKIILGKSRQNEKI